MLTLAVVAAAVAESSDHATAVPSVIGPDLAGLPWFNLAIAAALAAAGAFAWGVARYDDQPREIGAFARHVGRNVVVGLFVGAMVYSLAGAWGMGAWQTFTACGASGLAARGLLDRFRKFGASGAVDRGGL